MKMNDMEMESMNAQEHCIPATVLDIDLDFFLDNIANCREGDERLPSDEYNPWPADSVRTFLTRQCGLTTPLPGAVVTEHHELFDVWTSLIDAGRLSIPFNLIHVDAHADMGMGDGGYSYLCCELLHCGMNERRNPRRDRSGLTAGNYILFAIACRWISSITYVHHPGLRLNPHDIIDVAFKDNDPNCGIIQLKRFPQEYFRGIHRLTEVEPSGYEPPVPLTLVCGDSFHIAELPSFLFAAQSPAFTPATSDPLLDVIREFVVE